MTGHLDATYFASPAEFRRWLARNHAKATELWVGFHKKHTARPSLTWPESVAEALCYGWIDGLRRGVDAERYAIRFTPRKPTSIWSANNVAMMDRLIAEGRVHEAGLAAYAKRTKERTGIYSFERTEAAKFTADEEKRFRKNKAAWAFWESQPAGYRRVATHWVVSGKKAETRERRMATLIDDSANGLRVKPLRRP